MLASLLGVSREPFGGALPGPKQSHGKDSCRDRPDHCWTPLSLRSLDAGLHPRIRRQKPDPGHGDDDQLADFHANVEECERPAHFVLRNAIFTQGRCKAKTVDEAKQESENPAPAD